MPDSPLPGEPLRSGPVDPLTVAVQATLARRTAFADEKRERIRRRGAIWDMYHVQDLSTPQIAAKLREALLAAGLSEKDLVGEGVTLASIRRIVEVPRQGEPG